MVTAASLEALRREIVGLEQYREAVLASREATLETKPRERTLARYFHYPKYCLYVPIWGAASASELAGTEKRLMRLRAELEARQHLGEGGAA